MGCCFRKYCFTASCQLSSTLSRFGVGLRLLSFSFIICDTACIMFYVRLYCSMLCTEARGQRMEHYMGDPIAKLESQLELARRVRDEVADDPSFASIIDRIISNVPTAKATSSSTDRRTSSSSGVSQREQVIHWFHENDNRWVTAPDLARELGISRGSIANVLYADKAEDDFESKPHPQHGRKKLWRVREQSSSPTLNGHQPEKGASHE